MSSSGCAEQRQTTGSASNSAGPNLTQIPASASSAPRRISFCRRVSASSSAASGSAMPRIPRGAALGAAAASASVSDTMPSVMPLLAANTGVLLVSWHTNAQRFFTILSPGFARAPGRWHSASSSLTACAERACRSTFSSNLTLFITLRTTGFSFSGSTCQEITAVAIAESTKMSCVSFAAWYRSSACSTLPRCSSSAGSTAPRALPSCSTSSGNTRCTASLACAALKPASSVGTLGTRARPSRPSRAKSV